MDKIKLTPLQLLIMTQLYLGMDPWRSFYNTNTTISTDMMRVNVAFLLDNRLVNYDGILGITPLGVQRVQQAMGEE